MSEKTSDSVVRLEVDVDTTIDCEIVPGDEAEFHRMRGEPSTITEYGIVLTFISLDLTDGMCSHFLWESINSFLLPKMHLYSSCRFSASPIPTY